MYSHRTHRILQIAVAFIVLCSAASLTRGYSVLTHEAIIDLTWEGDIKPLLLKRFPGASAEDLRVAHAHAYGGAIIQDMGYYPFGSRFFSDLAHYVRSGDLIEALIRDSRDLNEYAFALGALCHYSADNNGHTLGTNRSVPILYPRLARKYGSNVTYNEDPAAHLRTEFGFDVLQVAKGRYASESYHDFIGFKVSPDLLERAFKDTYGIELKSVFTSLDLAFGSYRFAVGTIIPRMTTVAWETKRAEIEKQTPGITRDKFVYSLPRAGYEKEWGREYKKPGVVAKVLSFVFRAIPKVGPLKGLTIKASNAETEKLFLKSFDATVEYYRKLLAQVRNGSLDLQNRDLDTGEPARVNEYSLADKAYAQLLHKHASKDFEEMSPSLRENVLRFYADANQQIASGKDRHEWQKVSRDLAKLKTAGTQSGSIEKR